MVISKLLECREETGFANNRVQFAHSPPLEFQLVYSEKT